MPSPHRTGHQIGIRDLLAPCIDQCRVSAVGLSEASRRAPIRSPPAWTGSPVDQTGSGISCYSPVRGCFHSCFLFTPAPDMKRSNPSNHFFLISSGHFGSNSGNFSSNLSTTGD